MDYQTHFEPSGFAEKAPFAGIVYDLAFHSFWKTFTCQRPILTNP
jgi:hypothetical protein